MIHSIDFKKVRYALIISITSLVLTIIIKPLIENNQNAVNVIVTVFAILAGFLIALITLAGDPNYTPKGSWRIAFYHQDKIGNLLVRYKWLFYLYLMILLLVFVSFLLEGRNSFIVDIVEYSYVFSSVLAFILSLKIPSSVIKMHQERIEEEIMRRRRIDGIK
jgi:predicted tellurium resistance membrane protein TerC